MTKDSLQAWVSRWLEERGKPEWILQAQGYEPVLEREVESRLAIGNGFLGVRGSIEQPQSASSPRTYVAGLFDLVGAANGPSLIPGPDWLRLRIASDAGASVGSGDQADAYTRRVEFPSGLMIGGWSHQLPDGNLLRSRSLRLASLADRAIVLQIVIVEATVPTGLMLDAVLEAVTDGLVFDKADGESTLWRTATARHPLAVACQYTFNVGEKALSNEPDGNGGRLIRWLALAHEPAVFVRTVAIARHDDAAKAREVATRSLDRARHAGAQALLTSHVEAWTQRWDVSDIAVEGDEEAQRALRFAIYHLISTANPENERSSIGARGLTGDAYNGHVFWDTDIFLLPFYTLTWPEAARAMLMYRYHTLAAARAKAAGFGYRGALYAWESADTGEETTPESVTLPSGGVIPILAGIQEHHINADVAYAVWQYWSATGDNEFLLRAGAEIIVETARFWASRAQLEDDGLYHIRRVIGPDEYHDTIDDNAYTNMMAQWNLERGAEVAHLLQSQWTRRWEELRGQLDITDGELDLWRDAAARMTLLRDPRTGTLEQFQGFFQLEPVNLADYEPRNAPMDVLLGAERTRRSQVVKQADVVMLLALLWNRFTAEERAANFHYYEPRCGQGSSLSPPIHALVAARLGELDLADRFFREAASIDLGNTMGNAAGGVHMATMGGLWQAAAFGFAGLSLTRDGLRFDPHLPTTWRTLSFPVQWRKRLVRAVLTCEPLEVSATLERGRPLVIRVGSIARKLAKGEDYKCRFDPETSEWREAR